MKLKSHFRFDKQERSGIFFLLLIIVLLQIGYFFFTIFFGEGPTESLIVDEESQIQIDSLKEAALQKDSVKIFPFNPNFITDYKGYVLGMSVDEIDRLHAFRKQNKFANTPEEFQRVTQIPDSLLNAISPYFKFPEWTKKRYRSTSEAKQYDHVREESTGSGEVATAMVKDLNTATAEELRVINGIGEKLSARILKFRNRLGGFLSDAQLYDVYGLEPEVAKRALRRFKVLRPPDIQKININRASEEEIAKLIYIQEHIARRIVDYRNDRGSILSLDELKDIEGFPSDKISRIALYLSL